MKTPSALSTRLLKIVNALPLRPGMRVLEIGCGPGAAAREVAHRIGTGYVLAIDRSAKAIQLAVKGSTAEIQSGCLDYLTMAIEDFEWPRSEKRFDLAFAVRVGALDGRHPEIEAAALQRIARALTKSGKLYIDGGDPLREISLTRYR